MQLLSDQIVESPHSKATGSQRGSNGDVICGWRITVLVLSWFLFVTNLCRKNKSMLIHLRIFILLVLIGFVHSDEFIESSDGDSVVCVNIKEQPAFDNDLLKNHQIQMTPSEIPKTVKTNKKRNWPTTEARVSTAACPKGTIPILRDNSSSYTGDNTQVHEHAELLTDVPQKLYGTKVIINVWNPMIENKEIELSISQIWLSTGSYEKNDINTIEVGWQVYPQLYNDNKPRLFTFWTSDTYQKTGCYNLRCGGFVQTSTSIVLGGAITPVSVYRGRQCELTISVWKDRKHGNWWLSLGSDNQIVGYWPGELFTSLDYAEQVDLGGEILDSHSLGRHTKTHMGSGHFPSEGFGKASYFRNIEIVDNNNSFRPIQNLKTKTESKYYDVKKLDIDEWGIHFFYGGPGFSHIRSCVSSFRLSVFLVSLCFSLFIII